MSPLSFTTIYHLHRSHELPIDEENDGGAGNARCRANAELESYGSHSLEKERSNGDVEQLSMRFSGAERHFEVSHS